MKLRDYHIFEIKTTKKKYKKEKLNKNSILVAMNFQGTFLFELILEPFYWEKNILFCIIQLVNCSIAETCNILILIYFYYYLFLDLLGAEKYYRWWYSQRERSWFDEIFSSSIDFITVNSSKSPHCTSEHWGRFFRILTKLFNAIASATLYIETKLYKVIKMLYKGKKINFDFYYSLENDLLEITTKWNY